MPRTCTHMYTYEHLYRSRWNAHALLAVCRRISGSASFFAWQASVRGVDEKSLEPEAKSWPPHGPKQINKHTCFWQLTSLSGPDRHRAMPATGSEATFARRENYTKISFVKQSRGDTVTRTEPHMHLAMQVSYLASSWQTAYWWMFILVLLFHLNIL